MCNNKDIYIRYIDKIISSVYPMVILLLTLFSLIANDCYASENSSSEPVVFLGDIKEAVSLDQDISIYKDKSRALGIEDVLNKRFSLNNKSYINLGYNADADWFKFTVCNTGNTEETYLKIDKVLIDSIYLYSYNKQLATWDSLQLGLGLEEIVKSKLSSSIYFPIDIPANDTLTFYLRCVSVNGKTFSFSLINNSLKQQSDTAYSLFIGLYIGILLAITLYNLFLGFSVRDNLYFHYALANLFALLGGIGVKGFTKFIMPDSYIQFTPIITYSIISLYTPFACNFNIRILELRKTSRLAYYLMTGLAVFSVLTIITLHWLHYSGAQIHYSLVTVNNLLFTLAAIYAGIVALRKGNKYARFYLIGWASLFAGLLLSSLTLLGHLPKNSFTLNFYAVGAALEVLLLSFALADRYNYIQKEKNKLELDLQYKSHDLTKVVTDNKLRHVFKVNLLNQLKGIQNNTPVSVKKELSSFITDLSIQIGGDDKRNQLQDNLDKVNTEFELKLQERFPNLTRNEIEICSYLKLNLSIKEIAGLRNSSVKSVRMAKYRINKKMQEAGSSIDEVLTAI